MQCDCIRWERRYQLQLQPYICAIFSADALGPFVPYSTHAKLESGSSVTPFLRVNSVWHLDPVTKGNVLATSTPQKRHERGKKTEVNVKKSQVMATGEWHKTVQILFNGVKWFFFVARETKKKSGHKGSCKQILNAKFDLIITAIG